MKKAKAANAQSDESDDLRSEYDFDYTKARPNRFADRLANDRVLVLLDADVSKVFTSGESVNNVLRALITAMPKAKKKSRATRPS